MDRLLRASKTPSMRRQGRQRVVQVPDLGQLDDEPPGDDPVAAGGDVGTDEVDMAVCERPGDVSEQASAVEGLNLHLDQVGGLGVVRPGDGDEPLGLASELMDVLAVRPVYRDARALVMKPTIGSPGMGVQHRASLT